MSDVEETARDFLSRVRTNDDSGHGVCMDDVDVADLAEKFAVALDTPPKPDTSPVCVEVKELEWQDALPLRRDAIAGGLHYSVRSLTGRVDGPWIAQVTTAVNPYQTADLLSPGPLLEMLKACQADHERRTLELVNARSVESVKAERDRELEPVFAALKKHHDQALRVGSVIFPAEPDMPEPVEIDMSEAYADSAAYEETMAALALRPLTEGEG